MDLLALNLLFFSLIPIDLYKTEKKNVINTLKYPLILFTTISLIFIVLLQSGFYAGGYGHIIFLLIYIIASVIIKIKSTLTRTKLLVWWLIYILIINYYFIYFLQY